MDDDAVLWAEALASGGRAWAALFDRHHPRVFRHALRLLGSAHDADEVAAAAFFELWRRRDRVRVVDGSVLPWLLVTATNLGRNTARGLGRYRALLERLPRDDALDPVDVAALRIEARDRRDRLIEALAHLRPVDGALLALTELEGLTPAQAGAALGLGAGAARTRLYRTRLRLRGLLPDLDPAREGALLDDGGGR